MLVPGLIIAITLSLVEASPLKQLYRRNGYSVKETIRLPRDWTYFGEVSGRKEMVFSIGLKQGAFDELEKQLYEGLYKNLVVEIF